MATKRFHGKRWEYAVRRKQLLPKPLYLNFDSGAEGDVYQNAAEFVDACNCPQEQVSPRVFHAANATAPVKCARSHSQG